LEKHYEEFVWLKNFDAFTELSFNEEVKQEVSQPIQEHFSL